MTRLSCPVFIKCRLREEQEGKCAYCNIPTNAQIFRNESLVQLHEEFDHFIPIAYAGTNSAVNWVLACNVCNGIKSTHIFQNLPHARIVLETERSRKGYETALDYRIRVMHDIPEDISINRDDSDISYETNIYGITDDPDDWVEPTLNDKLDDPDQYDGEVKTQPNRWESDKQARGSGCHYLRSTGKVCMYCHGYNRHICLLSSTP